MAKRKPPVSRSRQRAATQRIVTGATPELVTMARIAEIRRQNGGSVRRGTVTGEYGASGTLNVFGRIYQEDYNQLFDGPNGVKIYDQMERSDAQVGSAVDIIRFPLRSARYRAVYPESATDREKAITDAFNDALFETSKLQEPWDFILRHLLMRIHLGFGLVEKVWTFDEDMGLLRWKRLAPRLPKTVQRFDVNVDGTLSNISQYVAMPGSGKYEERNIPAQYAVLSVREREGDNYFGRSVLRRVYKHWWYKDELYRIDGVRFERYGVGVPVAKIEQGHILEEDELREIELTLQALRSQDRAYVIEPPLVTFRIMTPEGGHGGATGLMDSVKHHDQQIVRAVLATFLGDHAEGLNTNRTRTLADIFLHALRAEANALVGDISAQLVRPFCDLNFDMQGVRYPTLEVTGLGDLTVEDYATHLPALATAGFVTPDDQIEDMLRKMLGLSPLTEGYKRGETKPVPVPPPGTQDPDDDGDDDDAIRPNGAEGVEVLGAIRELAQAVANSNAKPIILNVPPSNGHKARRLERDPMTNQILRIVEEDPR